MISLSFAAMPYRFLFLEVDSYLVASGIFLVKIGLKLYNFVLKEKVARKVSCKKD
jgi:hypothetical protein